MAQTRVTELVKRSIFNIILKVDSNLVKVQIWEVEEGVERISRFLAEMTKWKEVSFSEIR